MALWLGGFKGDSYDRKEFRAWLRTQKKPSFVSFITVHATGAPYTLAPIGGSRRITLGLRDYYQNRQKWKGGPHFFAMGDGRVYPGTPVHLPTVHSPSWNNLSISVEAEGDYRPGKMDWRTGQGKVVWDTMAWVHAELLEWMDMEVSDKRIRFHREDSATSHKECPGAMAKFWFIQQVKDALLGTTVVEKTPPKQVTYQPGEYQFSDYVVGMMKKIEGLRLKPYNDRGSLAIGYGHNASSGQPPLVVEGMQITEAEAEQILRADMTECLRYIKAWIDVPLTQGQVDALILFIFQQGATNFRNKAVSMINRKLHWSFAKYMENYTFKSDPTKGLDRRFKLQAEIYRGNRPTKW